MNSSFRPARVAPISGASNGGRDEETEDDRQMPEQDLHLPALQVRPGLPLRRQLRLQRPGEKLSRPSAATGGEMGLFPSSPSLRDGEG
jgi:hypothetical protein